MSKPISSVIRETIDTLQQAASQVKNTIAYGLGSAHKRTSDLFANKNAKSIPTMPIDAEAFVNEELYQDISLHPKAEQNLRNEYTQRFSRLLDIENGNASTEEKDIHSLLLEIVNNFNPKNLSPLAIIHFKAALNVQLDRLERALVCKPLPEDRITEVKRTINFKTLQEQLRKLKEILLPENVHRIANHATLIDEEVLVSGIGENAEDHLFAQKLSELAWAIQFKAEADKS